MSKVSGHLLQARQMLEQGRSPAQVADAVPLVRLERGRAQVELRLESLSPATLVELQKLGMEITGHSERWARVDGWLDPDLLDEVAALPQVATVHPQYGRVYWTGTTTSQADVSINADDVRTSLGVDGSGVTVGVFSDSFRDLSAGSVAGTGCNRAVTGTSSQTAGDISNTSGDVTVLDDGPGGNTDEARAIVELISDLAPGATYIVHSAANGETDFADGITEARACGADLMVDDVLYLGEPMFQDGPIAQAAQEAVDAGVPYFSSAGNLASFGVNDLFVDFGAPDDTAFPPSGDDMHDFGGGNRFPRITLPDDCGITAVLQWSEPFDGTLGPGASSDLDFYLLSSAAVPSSNVLTTSISLTGCGANPATPGCEDGICGDPLEILSFTNTTGGNLDVFLGVEHFCGSESIEMRIATFGVACGLTQDHDDMSAATGYDFENGVDFIDSLPVADGTEDPIFVDPQIYGHAAAAGVVAVAATFYGEIDTGGGVFPPFGGQIDVEPFSSLGGDLPFYFDGSGSPLPLTATVGGAATLGGPTAPETRFKPEITAPDGTNNTFFGSDIEPDGFPNFFGTSAAAPHATALAVLIWQITGEFLSPAALHQLIFQAIEEMELPGQDDLSGFGLADAFKGASALDASLSPLIDDLEFDLDGGAFFSSPPTGGLQRLQANDTLLLEDGDFSGLSGIANTVIFADGFESGDTSSWSN